jgi:hypothetical protein
MKSSLIPILLAALSTPAFAYQDGTYSCKNGSTGIPNNIYKIQSIPVPGTSATVPYVEITLHYASAGGDPSSKIEESHVSGFATVITSTHDGGSTLLQVAALQMEFNGNQLLNCK